MLYFDTRSSISLTVSVNSDNGMGDNNTAKQEVLCKENKDSV